MKKYIFLFVSVLSTATVFSQTAAPANIITGKILLNNGQKIIAQSNITIEADMSMGMQLNSTSVSENSLEVKNISDKNYTITSILTKLKVDFNMAGQATSYDSEKGGTPSTDIEKTLSDKLNKPVDVILDNMTGAASLAEKKEKESGNEN